MITTNAHEISLERGRLWIVLATIVINIVAVFRHLDAFYYLNDFASDFGPVWREGMLDRKLAREIFSESGASLMFKNEPIKRVSIASR